MSDNQELRHTFERPGFRPLTYTLELKSDQPAQPLDRAVVFLDAAVEALKQEITLCEKGSDRQAAVANLQAKATALRDRVLNAPAP